MSALPLRRWPAIIAGFVSGLLYAIAFAGNAGWTDHWAVAFVAIVPLWIALRGQTPRMGLLVGVVAGATMNVFGFYWLMEMLKTFSGFPWPLCALFVLIICSYQGGRFALLGW